MNRVCACVCVCQIEIRTLWFVTPTVFYNSKPSLSVCIYVYLRIIVIILKIIEKCRKKEEKEELPGLARGYL